MKFLFSLAIGMLSISAFAYQPTSVPLLFFISNQVNSCTIYKDKVIILLRPNIKVVKIEQIKLSEGIQYYIDLVNKGKMPPPIAHTNTGGITEHSAYGIVDPKAVPDESGLILRGHLFEETANSVVTRINDAGTAVDVLVSLVDSLCK